jgi:hypothetical protein
MMFGDIVDAPLAIRSVFLTTCYQKRKVSGFRFQDLATCLPGTRSHYYDIMGERAAPNGAAFSKQGL